MNFIIYLNLKYNLRSSIIFSEEYDFILLVQHILLQTLNLNMIFDQHPSNIAHIVIKILNRKQNYRKYIFEFINVITSLKCE